MSYFDGFETFNFEQGVPYVSITKNGVTFNKSVIMKLGYPENVNLLINSQEKVIAVKKCSSDTPNSMFFYKPNEKSILSVRWSSKDLLNTLQDLMGWDLSFSSYRVEGYLMRDEDAMIFELYKATLLV